MAQYFIGITDSALMETANVHFKEDGTPVSSDFDDVYFSQGHGIEETQHVFIDQNDLPNRFANLKPNDHFTIAETGFGTGLNFFVAWKNFLEHAPEGARLTFISCEKFPIASEHLNTAHAQWPDLSRHAEKFRLQSPPILEGFHLLEFERVNCLLMYGDASDMYSELSAKVDAWFLDGFAPSKNPEMWQPQLFSQLTRLSHEGTTAATFTAARIVRDGLSGAGFQLEKVPGFGRKRHMLRASFFGKTGPKEPAVWPSSELAHPVVQQGKRIAVVGSGIAALTTAIELKKRNFEITIIDQHSHPAGGGSGNSQGAVYAKLSATPTVANQFYAQALIKAQHALSDLPETVPHEATGLIQLVHDDREAKRLAELTETGFIPAQLAEEKSAEALSKLAGIKINDRGLWFPESGWVSPKSWVNHLLESGQFETIFETKIDHLEYSDGTWELQSGDSKVGRYDQVVLCTAFDTTAITQTEHLPLNPLAGQITRLEAQQHHHELKAVICTDRYVMPVINNQLTIGSTFRVKSTNTDITADEHIENQANLAQRLPNFLNSDEEVVGGRAATRCNAPDYLPLVGPISEPEAMKAQFRIPLQRNRAHKEPAAKHLPGLWVNVAHGSKGLCSSHLSAKYLAAMMSNEPHPVQASISKALNPNRFVVRALLREKRKKL